MNIESATVSTAESDAEGVMQESFLEELASPYPSDVEGPSDFEFTDEGGSFKAMELQNPVHPVHPPVTSADPTPAAPPKPAPAPTPATSSDKTDQVSELEEFLREVRISDHLEYFQDIGVIYPDELQNCTTEEWQQIREQLGAFPFRRLRAKLGLPNELASEPEATPAPVMPSAPPIQENSPASGEKQNEEDDLCSFLTTLKLGNYVQSVQELVGATSKTDLQFFGEEEWEQMATIMKPFQLKKIRHALSTCQAEDVPIPSGKNFHVFISHKKELSEELALLIGTELSANHKLSCFFDRDNLRRITKEELASSVQLSCVLLVVLDKKTIESEWCKLEWQTAKENDIPIICLYSKDQYNNNQFGEVITAINSHGYGFVLERPAVEYTLQNRHAVLATLSEMIKAEAL